MKLVANGVDDWYTDLEKRRLPTLEFTVADPNNPIEVCGNCGNTREEARGMGHLHVHEFAWWPEPSKEPTHD